MSFADDVVVNGELPGDNLGRAVGQPGAQPDSGILSSIQNQLSLLSQRLTGNSYSGAASNQGASNSMSDNLRILDTLTSVTSSFSQHVKDARSTMSAPVKRLAGSLELGQRYHVAMAADCFQPEIDFVHLINSNPEWVVSWDGVPEEYARIALPAASTPERVFDVVNVSPLAPVNQLAGDRLGAKILHVYIASIDAATRGNTSMDEDRLNQTMLRIISDKPIKLLKAIGAEVLPAITAGLRPEHHRILSQIQASFRLPSKVAERRLHEWNSLVSSNVFAAMNKFYTENEVRSFFRNLAHPEMSWGAGTGSFTRVGTEVNQKIFTWLFFCFMAFYFRDEAWDFNQDWGLMLSVAHQLTTSFGSEMSVTRLAEIWRTIMRMLNSQIHPLDFLENRSKDTARRSGPQSRSSSSAAAPAKSASASSKQPKPSGPSHSDENDALNRIKMLEEAVVRLAEQLGSKGQRVKQIAKYGLQRVPNGNAKVPPLIGYEGNAFSLLPPFK